MRTATRESFGKNLSLLTTLILLGILLAAAARPSVGWAQTPVPVAAVDDSGNIYAVDESGGTFSNYRLLWKSGGNARAIVTGDFNNDSYPDIIAGYQSNNVLYYILYTGSNGGAYRRQGVVATLADAGGWAMDIACGDFDSDGNLDFIASGDSGAVAVFLGDGAGRFVQKTRFTTAANGRGLDVADFNEDGNLDFVRATYGAGDVYLYLGDGAGNFSAGTMVIDLPDGDPYGVAAGDFDGDGHNDVIMNNGVSGDTTFYKGNGDGTFASGVAVPSLDVNNHGSFDAWDYNGDGKLDMVIANYSGRGIWFFPGNGDATFGTGVQLNLDNNAAVSNTIDYVLAIAAQPLPPLAGTPHAVIGANATTIAKGDTVTFNSTGSNDPDGSLTNYAWDFGDGSAVDQGPTITGPGHVYSSEGIFRPRLTVTDNSGRVASARLTVTVNGNAPTANTGGPYSLDESAMRFGKWWGTLDGSGSTDSEGIVRYEWDFGGSYFRDFEDNSETGWGKAEGTWAITGSPGSYRYSQSDAGTGRSRNLYTGTLPDDYVAEVDAEMTAGSGEEVQLLFDAVDIYNNFEFILRGRGINDLLLYRWQNGGSSQLAQLSLPFAIVKNTVYHLRVELRGTRLIAYLDGNLVFDMQVSRYLGGRAGFSTYVTAASFDNFKVTSIPQAGTSSKISHLFPAAGTYPVTLTVFDGAGRSNSAATTVAVSQGAPPAPLAGGPYTLHEADAYAGVWQLVADPSASTGHIYQYQWDFGDGTTMTAWQGAGTESFIAAGQVLYGYDVPGSQLFFTATQDNTHIRVLNLITRQEIGSNTLNRYGTWWQAGPGDNIPFKIETDKPVVVVQTNNAQHTAFIPALDGNGVGHEFIYYHYTSFGAYYLFAIEDTQIEVYSSSGSMAMGAKLAAGSYLPLPLGSDVYRIRSWGKAAIQLKGINSFTAVPAASGDGAGRLFYCATDSWGGGSLAVFAHADAQVQVYDMDSSALLYDFSVPLGNHWFQNGVGNRRLRVVSNADVEVWAGDSEGGATIDSMGDDLTFIGGKGMKDYYFRSGNDGAALFVPYDGTTVTVTVNNDPATATATAYNRDQYVLLGATTDYHVTASKPVFIEILGRANGLNDFGTYLPGITAPVHFYKPTAPDTLPKQYAVSLTATDHALQASTAPAATTVTLQPGNGPTSVAGPNQSAGEAQAVDGAWTFNFSSGSTDDTGIWLHHWDFGDGTGMDGKDVSHTYRAVGAYQVTLTVTDYAMQTATSSQTVTINAGSAPIANPGGPYTLDETAMVNGGWTLNLDGGGSTDDTGIIRYIWDLGTDTFDGVGFKEAEWLATGHVSQLNALALTGASTWDFTSLYSRDNFPRVAGMYMQATVKQSGGHAMIGWKNTGTRNHYDQMPYALYLSSGSFQIYEDGQYRASVGTYSFNTPYDIKIELKAAAGARYYYRPAGTGTWTLLFDSSYGTATEFKRGATCYSDTLWIDDLKEIAAGAQPTVRLYTTSAPVSLTVEDNAHQTDTKATTFTVTTTNQPPVANAGGPYLARDGLPILLDASKSTDDHGIVSYTWNFADGSVEAGKKILHKFQVSDMVYPVSATASSQYGSGSWNASQATGAPNVNACGDNGAAWTTSSFDMGEQWLEVSFAGPVETNGIRIRETYNPGFVIRIDLYDVNDTPVTVWSGTDTTACMGWLHAPVSPVMTTSKARIYINTGVPGWNEIDAVALVKAQAAGSEQVQLTVMDGFGKSSAATASVSIDPTPTVVAVPWQFHGGAEIPHTTWDGKETVLKAVAYDSSPTTLTYTWDFGDGSSTVSGAVTNPYVIEALHTYSGSEGTRYTARITVTDQLGHSHSDAYPVIVLAKGLDAEINVAIDDGLWWLHKNQYRNPGDFYHGRWSSYSSYYSSPTASALQAFAINGHLESGKITDDPYVETVWNGMDFLFRGGVNAVPIGPHPFGNPDGNGNGYAVQAADGSAPYQTGMLMDAIISSQTPAEETRTGNVQIVGRTYRSIVQDMVDMYAAGMSSYTNQWIAPLNRYGTIGGWRYNWGEWPDNSVSQWAAIGITPAEKNWGLTVPAWVKSANDDWLWYSFSGDRFGYTDSGYGNYSSIACRPSGMVQMVMDGKNKLDPPDPRWTATEGFFATPANWSWFITSETYYGWYAFTKAMRLGGVGENLSSGFNWFRGIDDPATPGTWGMARKLITRQESAGAERGRWISGGQVTHPGDYGWVFSSAWSVIMLTPTLFELGPVANAGGNKVWGSGIPLTFDASNSRHLDPRKKIVLYEWDFDSDGVYDSAGVSPLATHTYTVAKEDLPKTFQVTLRVTDNGEALNPPETPLQDTDTISVMVVEPPHPPVAVPGGPYQATVGVPVTLDGSRSYDIDAVGGDYITLFQWDLDGDWDFDSGNGGMDVQGDRATAAKINWTFTSPGTYNIGLRVWDNGVFNNNVKMSHTAYTTVTVTANEAPVAVLPPSYTVNEGATLNLDGRQSYDPNGTAVGQYLWDLNNDGVFGDAAGPLATYQWNDNGTFPIGLKVIDIADPALSSTATAQVQVMNVAPLVNAGSDQVVFGRLNVSVQGSYFDPAGSLDAPYTVLWNFGDGATAATLQASHAFAGPGLYTVTLTVTDKDGGAGTAAIQVRIVDNPTPAVVDASNGQVTLTWRSFREPAGLAQYLLYQSDQPFTSVAGMTPIKTLPAGTYTTTVTGLTNGTPVYFAVVGVDANGAYLAQVAAVTANPTEVDNPPLPVTDLTGKVLAGGKVELHWTPSPSPDAASYEIYGDNATGTIDYGSALGTASHPQATWTSAGLIVGQTYRFVVRTRDAGNQLEENTNAIAVTVDYPDLVIAIVTAPAQANYGTTANFTVEVTNRGSQPAAAPFKVGLMLDNQQVASWDITTDIGAGQTVSLPLSWQVGIPSRGTPYNWGFVVDPENAVAESDETNNASATQNFTINRVYSLTSLANPSFAVQGETILLAATAFSSDAATAALDDQTVRVKTSLRANGVTVGTPLQMTYSSAAGRFEYTLGTGGLWGPFDVVFKLYDTGETQLLATSQQQILVGATDYYVNAVSGSDSLGDGSQNNPWQSISFALGHILNQTATLHVAPGQYGARETFPILMKPGISLVGDPANRPTIAGQADRQVLFFDGAAPVPASTLVQALDIQGGAVGIHLAAGNGISPTLKDNIITGNVTGILCESGAGSSPAITNNQVKNNSAAGIAITASQDNMTGTASPLINGNLVKDNDKGIVLIAGAGLNQNNTIRLEATIKSTAISGNRQVGVLAVNQGGAWNSSPQLTLRLANDLIADNLGDGINLAGTSGPVLVTLRNVTVVNNTGAGIRADAGVTPTVSNTIVWGNGQAVNGLTGTAVSYSDFENGIGAGSSGNLAVDPRFVEPAAGDYRLAASSPLIDAGSNADVEATDLDGLSRVVDGNGDQSAVTDMGAYELPFPVSSGGNRLSRINQPLAFDVSVPGDPVQYSYAWQFGDGSSAAIKAPSHSFTTYGVFRIVVRVRSGSGATAADVAQVSVENDIPQVNAGGNQSVMLDNALAVAATFTDRDTQDTHTATINWGDGSQDIGVVVESNGSGTVTGSHTYANTGLYTVRVQVTDNNSGSGSGSLDAQVMLRGDVNGDNAVDLKDLILIMQVMTGVRPGTPVVQYDVDGNGRTGLGDAIFLLQRIAAMR